MTRLFRKRPVTIEAVEYTGDNSDEVLDFAEATYRDGVLSIETLEGVMSISPGDFVIRGIEGEYYPCKPAIFHATYDTVSDDPIVGSLEALPQELRVQADSELASWDAVKDNGLTARVNGRAEALREAATQIEKRMTGR